MIIFFCNLPADAGSSGMEWQILLYPVKPPQTEDIEDGITTYPGMTDGGDAAFDLAMNAKPLAKAVYPTNDYLAKPLNNNQ